MRQSRNLTLGRAITALMVVFALVATTPTWIAPVPAQDGGGDGGGGSGGSGGGGGSSGGSGSNGGSGSGNSGGSGSGDNGSSGSGHNGGSGSGNTGGSGSGDNGGSGSGNTGASGSGNNGGSGTSGSSSGSTTSGSATSGSTRSGSTRSGSTRSGRGISGEDNGYAGNRDRGAYGRRSGHQWGSTSADSARRAVKRGDVVPLGSVLPVVRAAVRGEVLEVDLRLAATGEWRYELLVLDSAGRYREVVVDARRNRILQIRRR